ncbi:MAG: AraC family transcriptional regulator [Anaerolineales bacterium]|nr:AraC family transcriptional regulator [Anaerolineales bacterium]
MVQASAAEIRLREGFRGQIQYVIPHTVLDRLSGHPLLHSLVPTDIGWYPAARYHYRERPEGAAENILIYCVAGAGWYEVHGNRFTLQAGEALLLPAGLPHTYAASDREPWSIHWVHFRGLEGDYFAQLPPEPAHKLGVDMTCAREVEALFQQCYSIFFGGFVLPRLIYGSKLVHHLLAELIYHNNSFSPSLRTGRFHSLEPTFAYLVQNLQRSLSLADMANQAGLSESQFSHVFKQQTGHSPLTYFIHLKMQHACSLLTLTQLSIKEIAQEIGYADSYYFSRLFKKIIGVAPSDYRGSP